MTTDTDSLECGELQNEFVNGEDSELENDEEPLSDGHHRSPDETAASKSTGPSISSSSQDCISASFHP